MRFKLRRFMHQCRITRDASFEDADSVVSDAAKLVHLQKLNPEAAKRLESLLHQDPQTAFRVLALADSLINYGDDDSSFEDVETPAELGTNDEELGDFHMEASLQPQHMYAAERPISEPAARRRRRMNPRRCRPRAPWMDLCLFSSTRARLMKQFTTSVAIHPEPVSAVSSFSPDPKMASAASGGDFVPAALRADKSVLAPRERSMPCPPATPSKRNCSDIPQCEDLNLKSPQPSARLVLPDRSTLRHFTRAETTEQASIPDELCMK